MSKQNDKPTVLLTNLFLIARTGSELHILEIARQFKKNGWDVTCYALVTGYPLQSDFQNEGITIVEFGQESQLKDRYNLFFAQHHLASEYIWHNTEIQFDKTIVSILGFVTDVESLPDFVDECDLLLLNSKETLKYRLAGQEASLLKKTLVFPNYADEVFFKKGQSSLARQRERLQSIAVVSNHIPDELFELAQYAFENNVVVEFFGYQTHSVEINSNFLSRFDLIISIGRTAQICFASQTPYYCYDHFGGPGYITKENFMDNMRTNFSGRSTPIKQNAVDLFQDITLNYSNALENLPFLFDMATKFFHLDSLFTELMERINGVSPSAKYSRKHKPSQKENCDNFVRNYRAELGCAQVYYSSEFGTCTENDSLFLRFRYNSEITIPIRKIEELKEKRILRFDPDLTPITCKLNNKDSIATALNAFNSTDGVDRFLTDDPIYLIDKNKQAAIDVISFSAEPISIHELVEEIDSLASLVKKFEAKPFSSLFEIIFKKTEPICG